LLFLLCLRHLDRGHWRCTADRTAAAAIVTSWRGSTTLRRGSNRRWPTILANRQPLSLAHGHNRSACLGIGGLLWTFRRFIGHEIPLNPFSFYPMSRESKESNEDCLGEKRLRIRHGLPATAPTDREYSIAIKPCGRCGLSGQAAEIRRFSLSIVWTRLGHALDIPSQTAQGTMPARNRSGGGAEPCCRQDFRLTQGAYVETDTGQQTRGSPRRRISPNSDLIGFPHHGREFSGLLAAIRNYPL